MILNVRKFLFLVLILSTIASCTYDSADLLYPAGECNTADMSYINDVVPIMSKNCYSCHSADQNQGGITIDDYANIKLSADNGSLLGSIKHVGYSAMPRGASKLNSCDISKVEAWINQGTKNN